MLDIRLKSKYKLFLHISVAMIVLFASLFTLFYPNIDQKAKEYHSKSRNMEVLERKQAGDLGYILINSTMVLTKQIREQSESRLLSNVEAYIDVEADESVLKRYEDEYETYLEIIDSFVVRSDGWGRSYNKYKNFFLSEVTSNQSAESLLTTRGLDYYESDEVTKVVLSYDTIGKMSVKEIVPGKSFNENIEDGLRRFLNDYQSFDPLSDYTLYLAKSEHDMKHEFDLRFKPPVGMDFVYYFDTNLIFGPDGVTDTVLVSYFFNYIIIAGLIVVLVGVGLSFLKDYSERSDKTNVPMEVVLFVVIAILSVSGSHIIGRLILATLNKNMRDFLFQAGLFAFVSDGLIVLLNVSVWSALLGMLLWLTLSLCAWIHLGPRRCFFERTLSGKLIGGIGRVYQFVFKSNIMINWNDSAFRQYGKWMALNFSVLLIMSMFRVNNLFGLLIYSLFVLAILSNYYNRKKVHFKKIINWMDTLARGELFFEEKSAIEVDPKKKVYIDENLGEFEPFDERLRQINDGFIKAVDKERESQRSKSELITNMSHDLKTPLTAIIMYINLLKDENISVEDRRKYIDILDAKSMRFKLLIDDLFEMSLASTGKLKLEKSDVDIVSLLKGLRLEYNEKIEEAGIDFRWQLPDKKCILCLDAKKTYRIFENLLVNITKYALKGSRAYITFAETKDSVNVTLTNISDIEITSNPEKLLERFARADTSRNTPGSGLGLAIAKNLIEAQGGEISIDVESDVFKINVCFYKNGTMEYL